MSNKNSDLYNKINELDSLYKDLESKLHLLDKKISELKIAYVKEVLNEE